MVVVIVVVVVELLVVVVVVVEVVEVVVLGIVEVVVVLRIFPYNQIETKDLFTSIAISGIKILSQGRRHILPTFLISIPFNVVRLTPSFVILVCSK